MKILGTACATALFCDAISSSFFVACEFPVTTPLRAIFNVFAVASDC